MNLVSLLEQRAAEQPETPALIDSHHGKDRVITFRQLAHQVSAGSALLDSLGLKKGMCVLVFHSVSIELYQFILSAFHRGLRVMLADPSAGREFLNQCCKRLQPDAFFGSWKANFLRLAVPNLRQIPLCITAGPWFPGSYCWNPRGPESEMVDVDDAHPALVTFTSGSTGVPKAAVRTHGFLLAQHAALSQSLRFAPGDVDLITLPVFVLANLASGMTSVIANTDLAHPEAPDTAAIHGQCIRHHVTRCAASPAFFEGLLRSRVGLPPFRKVHTGGAPVFPDLLDRLQSALPDALVETVYGSTEAEPISHFAADGLDEATRLLTRRGAGLCVGPPVPQIRLRIIDDGGEKPAGPMASAAFDALEVAIGQAGEIVVAGDHVLQGYLDGVGDEETKIQVDGAVWHRTGDAGWMDSVGRLWLLGRCAARLPGFPSPQGLPTRALDYPFAIECSLREAFPGIRTAALGWNGQRMLVIGGRISPETREQIRIASASLGITQWFHFEVLPLDRRHHAKIDYPSLAAMIRRTNAT